MFHMLLLFSAILKTFFWGKSLLFVLWFLMLQQSGVLVSVGILDHESRPSNRQVLYSVYSGTGSKCEICILIVCVM